MSTQTILICLVTYLLFLIARCKSCELAENSVYAAATHQPVSGSYSTYSCTPCPSAAYEVHVINIYEPSGTNRGFQQTIDYAPVHLQIKSDKAVDVKLVLMSYETADWEITKSSNVNILNVLVASYKDSYSSATLKNSTSTLRVQVEREYFSGWKEIDSVKTYVAGKFGHMSTFTGVYKTSSWDLTVGTCDNSITTTSKSNCPDGCWLKYSFTYEDNWNSCHGDQYITIYKQYYVGVVLCSSTRYKLFMSESLSERFLNIADSDGHGEDHCEFIGGRFEDMANLPNDFWGSPTTTGYYRSHWGGTVLKGPIGGSQTVLTRTHYVKWYECGVSVPGMSSMSTTPYIVEHTSESESSINVIAIIGLAVGVIVGLAVIIGVVAVVILLISKQRSRGQPGQVVSNPAWNGGQGGAMYSSAQPGQVSWQQQHNPAINPPQPMGHNAHSSTQMNGVYAAPVQSQSGPPPNYYEALQVSKPVGNNGEEVSQNYESLHPKANRQSGEEGIYLEITNS